MKTSLQKFVFTAALLTAPLMASGGFNTEDVEPCINGAVSASGLFPSQALEDEYNRLVARLEQDPCAAGAGAAPWVFPNRQMEQRYAALVRAARAGC